MKSELYIKIKSLEIDKLTEEDKDDLLRIFRVVKNSLIRDQISFIFSDLKYDLAIPAILEKVFLESNYDNNGSLVYSLQGLDTARYFLDIIKIICTQGYEARLMAYDIIIDKIKLIPESLRSQALEVLYSYKAKLPNEGSDFEENSTLHFIEQTIKYIKSSGATLD